MAETEDENQNKETGLKKIPKYQDLVVNPDEAFKLDIYNMLIFQPPKEVWVKEHPYATKVIVDGEGRKQTVPLQYVPIERIEVLMSQIFQQWYVEVLDVKALFQSIAVTVRVHYKHKITGEWMHQDGVGAVPVQVDAKASAADLSKVKSNAIQIGLPAAKSYAVKDACEQIGPIFGANLNRAEEIFFKGMFDSKAGIENTTVNKEVNRIFEHLKTADSLSKLEEVKDSVERHKEADVTIGENQTCTLLEYYYKRKDELK